MAPKETSAEGFIQSFLLRAANQCARQDLDMTTNSVMLRKRYKDMGPDNWFGVFDSYGTWSVPNARNLYPLNIIKPMVRANTAALVSANVKVNIEPRVVKDVHAEMVADVARSINDLKTEEQWTHQLIEQTASECQIAPGIFLWVDWDEKEPNHFVSSIDEWETEEWNEGGQAICKSCGYESDVGEFLGEEPTMACENCGAEAEIVEMPEKQSVDIIKDTAHFKAGNTTTKVISSAEIVMDDRGTAGGNIAAARWIIHRHLDPSAEIEAKYPDCVGAGLGGASTDWSYPLRWQYAMATGNDQPYYTPANWVDDLREVRDVYLTPEMYQHIKLNKECKVGKFKATGSFGAGTYNGKAIKTDKGLPTLCFRTVSEQLIDIYPYEVKDKLIYISFLSNPSGFYGLFLTEMLPIQDVVNYMNSIQVFHTRRNARTTKVLDSGMYNPEDLEKDVVLTKEPLSPEQDIRKTFGYIPSATLSQVPQMLLQSHLAVSPAIGGVTPAQTGQPQSGETYSAVRQQKEQSLGQLVPFLKSLSLGKVSWTIKQLKEAQANWTEEDFLFLLKLNSDWTEEYIEAFLSANLDTDIIVEYEPGSDAPRNLLDREMALQQFIATLAQLTELSAIGSPLATPGLCAEILTRIKQFTQVDVDVNDFEAEIRLADSRADKLQFLTEGMKVQPGAPTEMLNMLASQLVALPDLKPFPFENHATETEFYVDMIEQELSKQSPNHLLVACWYAMINSHQQAAVEQGQIQTQAQMAVQAPAMEQQSQMAAQQQQGEAEAQAAQVQAEQEGQDADANRQLQMDAVKEGMNAERVQADQQHQLVMEKQRQAYEMRMKQTEMADKHMDRQAQKKEVAKNGR